MSASLQLEGFQEIDKKFGALYAALRDERVIAAMMIEAAQPMVDAAKAIVGTGVPTWIESGDTARDIGVEIDKERAVGSSVAVSVGAHRRSPILRFLEFGTSEQPAYPVLRPAWDQTRGAVSASIVAGLRSLVSSALK
jgi:HK97 gp10 family phage protein